MGFRKQACVVLILVLCAGSVILCLSMKPPQVNLLKSTQGSAVLSICSSRLAAVVTQLSDRHTESALRGLWGYQIYTSNVWKRVNNNIFLPLLHLSGVGLVEVPLVVSWLGVRVLQRGHLSVLHEARRGERQRGGEEWRGPRQGGQRQQRYQQQPHARSCRNTVSPVSSSLLLLLLLLSSPPHTWRHSPIQACNQCLTSPQHFIFTF